MGTDNSKDWEDADNTDFKKANSDEGIYIRSASARFDSARKSCVHEIKQRVLWERYQSSAQQRPDLQKKIKEKKQQLLQKKRLKKKKKNVESDSGSSGSGLTAVKEEGNYSSQMIIDEEDEDEGDETEKRIILQCSLGTLSPISNEIFVRIALYLPLSEVVHRVGIVSYGFRQHLFAAGASYNYWERILSRCAAPHCSSSINSHGYPVRQQPLDNDNDLQALGGQKKRQGKKSAPAVTPMTATAGPSPGSIATRLAALRRQMIAKGSSNVLFQKTGGAASATSGSYEGDSDDDSSTNDDGDNDDHYGKNWKDSKETRAAKLEESRRRKNIRKEKKNLQKEKFLHSENSQQAVRSEKRFYAAVLSRVETKEEEDDFLETGLPDICIEHCCCYNIFKEKYTARNEIDARYDYFAQPFQDVKVRLQKEEGELHAALRKKSKEENWKLGIFSVWLGLAFMYALWGKEIWLESSGTEWLLTFFSAIRRFWAGAWCSSSISTPSSHHLLGNFNWSDFLPSFFCGILPCIVLFSFVLWLRLHPIPVGPRPPLLRIPRVQKIVMVLAFFCVLLATSQALKCPYFGNYHLFWGSRPGAAVANAALELKVQEGVESDIRKITSPWMSSDGVTQEHNENENEKEDGVVDGQGKESQQEKGGEDRHEGLKKEKVSGKKNGDDPARDPSEVDGGSPAEEPPCQEHFCSSLHNGTTTDSGTLSTTTSSMSIILLILRMLYFVWRCLIVIGNMTLFYWIHLFILMPVGAVMYSGQPLTALFAAYVFRVIMFCVSCFFAALIFYLFRPMVKIKGEIEANFMVPKMGVINRVRLATIAKKKRSSGASETAAEESKNNNNSNKKRRNLPPTPTSSILIDYFLSTIRNGMNDNDSNKNTSDANTPSSSCQYLPESVASILQSGIDAYYNTGLNNIWFDNGICVDSTTRNLFGAGLTTYLLREKKQQQNFIEGGNDDDDDDDDNGKNAEDILFHCFYENLQFKDPATGDETPQKLLDTHTKLFWRNSTGARAMIQKRYQDLAAEQNKYIQLLTKNAKEQYNYSLQALQRNLRSRSNSGKVIGGTTTTSEKRDMKDWMKGYTQSKKKPGFGLPRPKKG